MLWGPFHEAADENTSDISVTWMDFFDDIVGSQGDRLVKPRVPHQYCWLSKSELSSLLLSFLDGTSDLEALRLSLVDLSWEKASRESFDESFERIRKHMTDGELVKAVPIVFEHALFELSLPHRAYLILNLLDVDSRLHVYGYWNSVRGFLGASPELLFTTQGLKLSTMALAGTLPKATVAEMSSAEAIASLLHDKKEREEHQWVIDDLHLLLQRIGQVTVEETEVLELPMLYHLYTPISVKMKEGLSIAQLLGLLHPTPALGVAPRSFNFRSMQAWPEQKGRRSFGAPFVIHLRENGIVESTAVVAIRQIQWDECKISIGSGCGVVKDSKADREWHELTQKRLSVKKVLGLIK